MEKKAIWGIMLTLLLVGMLTLAFAFNPVKAYIDGMVSYWRFDEGNGSTAYDSADANDGTIYGATWTTGKVDDALSFDGDGDYVWVSDDPSLDISEKITIEAWINITDRSDFRAIVVKQGNYHFRIHNGYLQFVHWTTGGWRGVSDDTTLLDTHTWYHVAVSFDTAVNDIIKLYVNGNNVKTQTYGWPLVPSDNPFTIGRQTGALYTNYFNGTIDEVAIYNRILTPKEIQQHYDNGLIGKGYIFHDWPMIGYDPASTSFSPSTAPNTNATAWVSDMPGGSGWSSPVVAEGKVFIGIGWTPNFTAWDEETGDFLWSFEAAADIDIRVSAAVVYGMVFFGAGPPSAPEGWIYALNATTGEQIWNFTTEGDVRASPVVTEGRLYIGGDLDSTGKVYCINATTGESIWNYTTQDRMTSVAVAYGKVYASSGHWETSTKAAIYALDMYDGSLVWSFDTDRTLAGTLSVANGNVYFAVSNIGSNFIFYALNATNGNEIWNTTRYSNGEGGRTAVAYGKVFFVTGRGARGVYALNETNGDEIWAFPIIPEEPVPGHYNNPRGGPVVADGKVFFAVAYPSHMFYAVNETTGAVVWSYELGGSVHSSSSAIANGRVFVADHYDKKLYAFGGPPYVARIKAYCYTEGSDISVGITMDGSPTGYNTPHSFTELTGTHNFTVPDTDLSGHPFAQWNTGETSTTITVNSGGTYTAYYGTRYNLTITTTTGGTTNPSSGTHTYMEGTIVSVTAIPDTNYVFDHWELDGSWDYSNPISVTMDSDHTLRAVFEYSPPPVGGIVSPVDKLGLLAPYIAFAIAVVAITVGAVYARKRWFGKAVVQTP